MGVKLVDTLESVIRTSNSTWMKFDLAVLIELKVMLLSAGKTGAYDFFCARLNNQLSFQGVLFLFP
jgi:hypothetical protein